VNWDNRIAGSTSSVTTYLFNLKNMVTDFKRILVVDDSPVQQRMISMILESVGFPCEFVCDGTDALDKIDSTEYAAVLVDLQMPDLDGFSTARSMLRHQQDLIIIGISAHETADIEQKCLAAGMKGFLAKPISRDTLKPLLEKILGITVAT
jgi:CheY-like chemotaxis protein